MGFGDRITADLNPPTMFHAVSQGALGVEVRSDDAEAIELCKKLTHRDTQYRCLAERACLRVLEGGCSVPVGVATEISDDLLKITGCVTSLNGDEHVEHTIEQTVKSPEEAEQVGQKLAKVLIEYAKLQKFVPSLHQDSTPFRISAMGPDAHFDVNSRSCTYCKAVRKPNPQEETS